MAGDGEEAGWSWVRCLFKKKKKILFCVHFVEYHMGIFSDFCFGSLFSLVLCMDMDMGRGYGYGYGFLFFIWGSAMFVCLFYGIFLPSFLPSFPPSIRLYFILFFIVVPAREGREVGKYVPLNQ